ncbi:hypothetical protein A2U01_0068557, partial [Trifolium medium]|nr:hypothetical protein [Trifolium medium]
MKPVNTAATENTGPPERQKEQNRIDRKQPIGTPVGTTQPILERTQIHNHRTTNLD